MVGKPRNQARIGSWEMYILTVEAEWLVSRETKHALAHAERKMRIEAQLFAFFFFFLEEALNVSLICHRSNIRRQPKETSGMKAYTARPTTGEAALPWQAIRM